MEIAHEKILYSLLDRYRIDNQERYADKQIRIIELIMKDIRRDIEESRKKK